MQPVGRRRRLEGEPGQLAHELERIPVDRGPHVEADDLDRDKAEDQRGDPERAEIERPDLRVAETPEPGRKNGVTDARQLPLGSGTPMSGGPRTWTRVKMF